MRLGILTGGGDVPGLNSCIKAAATRITEEGHEMFGLRRGWAGLLHYNPDDPATHDDLIISLDKNVVRTIDRTGGTFLHTSRTNPGKVKPKDMPEFLKGKFEHPNGTEPADCTAHALRVLEHLKLDGLIAIGGDDTLSYAVRLHKEGFPMVCIPKTMDNDVYGTDYCIGFSTAVTRSVDFIHAMRTPSGSHERIAVIELFGRYSGETSLISAYLAGVDRAIISEVDFDVDKLVDFLIEDRKKNPSHYAIMTVSEGAKPAGGGMFLSGEADAYGHKKLGGIGEFIARSIEKRSGIGVMFQQLGYLMRSGAPDSLDLMVAANFAHMAMSLVERGESGRLVCLQRGVYSDVPISTLTQGKKHANVAELYDTDCYRPRVRHVLGMPMFLT